MRLHVAYTDQSWAGVSDSPGRLAQNPGFQGCGGWTVRTLLASSHITAATDAWHWLESARIATSAQGLRRMNPPDII